MKHSRTTQKSVMQEAFEFVRLVGDERRVGSKLADV